jgi:hypothetical protein
MGAYRGESSDVQEIQQPPAQEIYHRQNANYVDSKPPQFMRPPDLQPARKLPQQPQDFGEALEHHRKMEPVQHTQ